MISSENCFSRAIHGITTDVGFIGAGLILQELRRESETVCIQIDFHFSKYRFKLRYIY